MIRSSSGGKFGFKRGGGGAARFRSASKMTALVLRENAARPVAVVYSTVPKRERLSLQELHDDEGLAWLLLDLMNHADVGMVECGGGSGFALESLERRLIARHLFRQEFEGHQPAELCVFGLVDHTHTAASELLEDAVVRDGLANHGHRAWQLFLCQFFKNVLGGTFRLIIRSQLPLSRNLRPRVQASQRAVGIADTDGKKGPPPRRLDVRLRPEASQRDGGVGYTKGKSATPPRQDRHTKQYQG